MFLETQSASCFWRKVDFEKNRLFTKRFLFGTFPAKLLKNGTKVGFISVQKFSSNSFRNNYLEVLPGITSATMLRLSLLLSGTSAALLLQKQTPPAVNFPTAKAPPTPEGIVFETDELNDASRLVECEDM